MHMDLVFVDANVLFSRTLRDWTFLLSTESERFAVVSSLDCIIEAVGNIRERNPEAEGGTISYIHDLIERSLHDVVREYPGGPIEGMTDEKDWHVVHAATQAGAKILVTDNMEDFAPIADSLPFDLYTADDLFMLLAHNDSPAVEAVTMRQVRYWVNVGERFAAEGKPAPKKLAQALRDAGATKFAEIIDKTLRKLSGKRHSPDADTVNQADAPVHAAADADPDPDAVAETVPSPA